MGTSDPNPKEKASPRRVRKRKKQTPPSSPIIDAHVSGVGVQVGVPYNQLCLGSQRSHEGLASHKKTQIHSDSSQDSNEGPFRRLFHTLERMLLPR